MVDIIEPKLTKTEAKAKFIQSLELLLKNAREDKFKGLIIITSKLSEKKASTMVLGNKFTFTELLAASNTILKLTNKLTEENVT